MHEGPNLAADTRDNSRKRSGSSAGLCGADDGWWLYSLCKLVTGAQCYDRCVRRKVCGEPQKQARHSPVNDLTSEMPKGNLASQPRPSPATDDAPLPSAPLPMTAGSLSWSQAKLMNGPSKVSNNNGKKVNFPGNLLSLIPIIGLQNENEIAAFRPESHPGVVQKRYVAMQF